MADLSAIDTIHQFSEILSGPADASPRESETVNAVEHLFSVARNHRKPIVEQWRRNYMIQSNRTWPTLSHPDHLPSPEVPEIRPILSTIVGWQTDRRPELTYTPSADANTDYWGFFGDLAADLETVVQAAWHNHGFAREIALGLWDGGLYGIGFWKATWNATLLDGLGDIYLERVDPYSLYVDPAAKSLHDANYIIHARRMSILELDRRWPGAGKKLSNAEQGGDVDEAPTRLDERGSATRVTTTARAVESGSTSYGRPGQSRLSVRDDPGTVTYECWVREHTHEKDGDDLRTVDEWRVIVAAGGRVLMDEYARDLVNHPSHPFVRYVPEDDGEFYPVAMAELLTPAQLSINQLLCSLEHNIQLTGDPIMVADSRSGVARTLNTNQPGRRFTPAPGAEVDWLQPPQVNNMALPLVEFYIDQMERISGLYAMTRGNIPSGRNSENVLDQLQEASFVRIRNNLRNEERALVQIGQIFAHLVGEFYDVPRIVQYVGPEHQRTALALKARHFKVPTAQGSTIPLQFQVSADVGAEEPLSRVARAAESDVLRGMGSISIAEHLKMHGIKDANQKAQEAIQEQAGMEEGAGAPGARERAHRTG